jgi:hypothetical protein
MSISAWLWGGRARRNLIRAVKPLGPVAPLVDELAPGHSFVDVGALWNVHGKIAFRAEEHGATAVTAMDVSAETDEYLAEHSQRASKVRFVHGDVHDPTVRATVGPHDVVWCSGVLYHCPNPIHTISCLRELVRETLVLITATIPEAPGVEQACVFYPGLSERQRRAYDKAFDAGLGGGSERAGLTSPFNAANTYANWWWGMTPSAVCAMLTAKELSIQDVKTNGFHTRIVATKLDG